jgi:hypothetical protein
MKDYGNIDGKRWNQITNTLEKRFPEVDWDDWQSEIADQLLTEKSDEEIIEVIRNAAVEFLMKLLKSLTK